MAAQIFSISLVALLAWVSFWFFANAVIQYRDASRHEKLFSIPSEIGTAAFIPEEVNYRLIEYDGGTYSTINVEIGLAGVFEFEGRNYRTNLSWDAIRKQLPTGVGSQEVEEDPWKPEAVFKAIRGDLVWRIYPGNRTAIRGDSTDESTINGILKDIDTTLADSRAIPNLVVRFIKRNPKVTDDLVDKHSTSNYRNILFVTAPIWIFFAVVFFRAMPFGVAGKLLASSAFFLTLFLTLPYQKKAILAPFSLFDLGNGPRELQYKKGVLSIYRGKGG